MQASEIAIPILPSCSLRATLHFYQALGFAGEILGIDDSYAILTRGDIELHFFSHPNLVPADSFAGCYIRLSNVEALYKAFQVASLPKGGIPRMDTIADKPWGMREFAVVDQDGNLLRIGQEL
jgi:catechol 2,3-dioxygenase-like lactoylglutathione lyase family enzyme